MTADKQARSLWPRLALDLNTVAPVACSVAVGAVIVSMSLAFVGEFAGAAALFTASLVATFVAWVVVRR